MKNLFSFLNIKTNSHKSTPWRIKYLTLIGGDPFVDWVLIIITVLVITMFLIGIGGYVYVNTQTKLDSEGSIIPNSESVSSFDIKKLNYVIEIFDGRANERVVLGKGYIGPKDPSLP